MMTKFIYVLSCLVLSASNVVKAEVITDGSVGGIKNLSGQMIIPQTLGTTVGNNLFHSFKTFNINAGESATFTGAENLNNVISRVTGGEISNINGLLKSEIGTANFYFINPAGIMFGENARVDVPAAFHLSTADKLNFADGKVFNVANLNESSLSIAEPESFGFVGKSLTNTGAIEINGSSIQLKPSQTLDLVAKNIDVKNNADLFILAGEIRFVAMQGDSMISLRRNFEGSLSLPELIPNIDNAGSIILNESKTETTGNGGGRITLWGSNIIFKNSFAFTDNSGALNATESKGINIRSNLFSLDHSNITSDVFETGNSGNMIINTANLNIFNNSFISSSNWGLGNSGVINIIAEILQIDGLDMGIYTDVEKNSLGNTTGIQLNVGTLHILNGAEISSTTYGFGNAGDIKINAHNIVITGADIKPCGASSNGCSEMAGNIKSLTYDDDGADGKNYISNFGRAGNIEINTDLLSILDGGTIATYSRSTGQAGDVNITAKNILINGHRNQDGYPSIIDVGAYAGDLPGGKLNINTGTIEISNGGALATMTSSRGDAGDAFVTANSVVMHNSGINGVSGGAGGKSGDTVISAETINLYSSSIASPTTSPGNAGSIFLTASLITLDNSSISAEALKDSSGQTGNITVTATKSLQLTNQSKISIENNATVIDPTAIKAGIITISATDINLNNSSITTVSNGNIDAGNINTSVSHQLKMDNASITTSAVDGNGGNINVVADLLLMNSAAIQANAQTGTGGDIGLNLNALIPSQESLMKGGTQVQWLPNISGFNVIQAASATGISGNINLNSPQLNINGFVKLFDKPPEKTDLNQTLCQGAVSESSFIRSGKGGTAITNAKAVFVAPIRKQKASVHSRFQKYPRVSFNLVEQTDNQPCTAR